MAIDSKFARRRRLLKIGASGVPVALTLASRPVLAWRCDTTSAWGSAQMMPTNSVQTRVDSHSVNDECWTLANWVSDNTTGSNQSSKPWSALKNSAFRINGAHATKLNFCVKHLFNDTGSSYPPTLSGDDKVWDKLQSGSGASSFAKYMSAAKLNLMLKPALQSCLISNGENQLNRMVTGTYIPRNIGTSGSAWNSWNQSEIIQYLQNNWIVRAN